MKKILLILTAMAMIVSGCTKTTVILLPDDDGNVGKVTLNTKAGETLLSEKNQIATASSENSKPETKGIASDEEIKTQYKDLIEAVPMKPVSFLVYFKFGTSQLTAQSLKLIPEVVTAAKEREPSEISIIGHSDTMGAENYNIKLSLKRANVVKKILTSEGMDIKHIEVTSHGENDLLIKTKDGVSNAKNRRVEIMIR